MPVRMGDFIMLGPVSAAVPKPEHTAHHTLQYGLLVACLYHCFVHLFYAKVLFILYPTL